MTAREALRPGDYLKRRPGEVASLASIAEDIAEWAADFGYRQGNMIALLAQVEVDGGLACYGR